MLHAQESSGAALDADFGKFLESLTPKAFSCKGPDANPPIGPCDRLGTYKWDNSQLRIIPPSQAGYPGQNQILFYIPWKSVPSWFFPTPAVWNILYGDRAPANYLDPDWTCGVDRDDEQYWDGAILPTAAPATNACILIQADIETRFNKTYTGLVIINIPGQKQCQPGQQKNTQGGCATKNLPSSAQIQTFCSGKNQATNACVDPSGNLSSLISGTSGPCANNLTQQINPIQCQLVNSNPPASSGNAGGSGVIITWDEPGTGVQGCAPNDPNCPCWANAFTEEPCSWVASEGIDPKTGKPLTGSGNAVGVPMPPLGALDQEGLVGYESGYNQSLTGWGTAPAGWANTATAFSLFRDSFMPGETGTYLVATSAAYNGPTGSLRQDINNQLINYPSVGFFDFSSSTIFGTACSTPGQQNCMPSGYYGALTVMAEDANETWGTIGKTYWTLGQTPSASYGDQIGIASVQATAPYNGGGSTQVITIPLHDNYGGAAAIDEIVVAIQPASANGQPTAANDCYVVAYPTQNGTFTPGGTVFLGNNAGNGWQGSGTLNQPITGLGNSQCSLLYAAYTSISGNDDAVLSLTLAWNPSQLNQTLQVFAYWADQYGGSSSWIQAGAVTPGQTVALASGPYVTDIEGINTVVAVSNQNASPTMVAGTITEDWYDATSTVNTIYTLIGTSINAAHSCFYTFFPASGQVWLSNDAGNGNIVGTVGTGSINNSQCTLNLAASVGGQAGTGAGLAMNVTFNPSWTGHKTVYTDGTDAAGSAGNGWQAQGSLVLP